MKNEKWELLSEVLEPAKFLEQSNLRKDLPEDFAVAEELWHQVIQDVEKRVAEIDAEGGSVEKFLNEIKGRYEFNNVDGLFKKSCWSWVPSGKTVRFVETDRMGQHFFGAMYTCKDFEWPMHEGCPCEPLFQLDLDKTSEIAAVDIGSGLLQLFKTAGDSAEEEFFLIEVPRKKVSEDQLTPLPTFDPKQTHNFEDIFGAKSECISVERFTDKRFSMPYDLGSLDEFLWVLEKFDDELLKSAASHMVIVIDLLNKLREEIGNKYFDLALFGYVAPIQTEAWEMPDPLIKLGGCRHLIKGWSDDSKFEVYGDGDGQVYLDVGEYFIENPEGELNYIFHGDC